MSIALGVTAAVALIAVVALVLTMRTSKRRLNAERARAGALTERAEAAQRAADDAGRRADETQQERDRAIERAEAAEQERLTAEQERLTAEEQRRQAEQQRDDAEQQGAATGADAGGLVMAAPLWDLERLRLEREWTELVGPSVPLPLAWDGSLWTFIAVQLEIIREQIGTPSRLEPSSATWAREPATAVPAARLATELLRRLAMEGEEIMVKLGEDVEISVAIATDGPPASPDLASLSATAAALGGDLALHAGPSELTAHLRLAAPGRPTA
jgi:hypothetical protein